MLIISQVIMYIIYQLYTRSGVSLNYIIDKIAQLIKLIMLNNKNK